MINIDTIKNSVKNYVTTSQYYIDISAVLMQAKEHIAMNLDKPNACVILDIDQTAIDQYSLMLDYDFGWFSESFEAADTGTDFPAIKETLDFFNTVKKYVPIIFLTSKREKYDSETIMQLHNAGFDGYYKLITRPNDSTGTIQDFKINERKKIVESGMTIIANIGDQDSDLSGGYPAADYCFKLPNPFYLISDVMVKKDTKKSINLLIDYMEATIREMKRVRKTLKFKYPDLLPDGYED